jgi:hypothetical protein
MYILFTLYIYILYIYICTNIQYIHHIYIYRLYQTKRLDRLGDLEKIGLKVTWMDGLGSGLQRKRNSI